VIFCTDFRGAFPSISCRRNAFLTSAARLICPAWDQLVLSQHRKNANGKYTSIRNIRADTGNSGFFQQKNESRIAAHPVWSGDTHCGALLSGAADSLLRLRLVIDLP
jgi:hypothetical protein